MARGGKGGRNVQSKSVLFEENCGRQVFSESRLLEWSHIHDSPRWGALKGREITRG